MFAPDAAPLQNFRANLTSAQEASAVFRRKAIYETIHPETKHGGDRKSDQVANSATRFTQATSDATGKAERTIRQAAARGEAIGEAALAAIAGTSLDKGVELDALAKMPADDRRAIIDRFRAAGSGLRAARPDRGSVLFIETCATTHRRFPGTSCACLFDSRYRYDAPDRPKRLHDDPQKFAPLHCGRPTVSRFCSRT
jgi:hypothetical protein